MKAVVWIVLAWLAGHVVLIAGHVLLVFLYSVLVAPGLTSEDYTAFAMASGPWFSIIVGGPVFYALGRMLVSRLGGRARTAGLVTWLLYSSVDAAVVLMTVDVVSALLAGQWLLSQGIKLAAVLWATRTPVAD